MNLLYLGAFIPSPADDGDKVRAMWTLRALASRHRIYGFFLSPDGRDRVPAEIRALCRDAIVVPQGLITRCQGAVRALLTGRPLHTDTFWNTAAQDRLSAAVARWPVDAVHVHRIRMMPYAERLGMSYMLDCTDSIANYYRLAVNLRGWRKVYARWDRRQVEAAERRWGNGAESVLAITAAERRKLIALGIRTPVFVTPNGLDLNRWRWSAPARSVRDLVFLGNLAYPPNQQGLAWFIAQVAPRLKHLVPGVRLTVVGGGAPRTLLAQGAAATIPIRFAGFVPDVRTVYRGAGALVCPLPTAAGLQNKMLEAMACGIPVITTPNVAAGANARPGRDVLVAADPARFSSLTAGVIGSPALRLRLSRNARRLIERRYAATSAVRPVLAAARLLERAVRQS